MFYMEKNCFKNNNENWDTLPIDAFLKHDLEVCKQCWKKTFNLWIMSTKQLSVDRKQ